jgi:hypothetical protein
MERIDNFDNLDDQLINLEARLSKDELNTDLLIRESFVLWYMLIEGIHSEYFSEDQLSELLSKNYRCYKENFEYLADYNFIIGWMINVAFWLIDDNLRETDGSSLLLKAYKRKPDNSLFKWAVRQYLHLTEPEILDLQREVTRNFFKYFNYGPIIKGYFTGVLDMSQG